MVPSGHPVVKQRWPLSSTFANYTPVITSTSSASQAENASSILVARSRQRCWSEGIGCRGPAAPPASRRTAQLRTPGMRRDTLVSAVPPTCGFPRRERQAPERSITPARPTDARWERAARWIPGSPDDRIPPKKHRSRRGGPARRCGARHTRSCARPVRARARSRAERQTTQRDGAESSPCEPTSNDDDEGLN